MRPRLRPQEVGKPDNLVHRRDGAGRGIPAPFDLMHLKVQQGKGAWRGKRDRGKRLLRLSAKEKRVARMMGMR